MKPPLLYQQIVMDVGKSAALLGPKQIRFFFTAMLDINAYLHHRNIYIPF